MRARLLGCVALLLALGCDAPVFTPTTDSGADAGPFDGGADAGTDAGTDAGPPPSMGPVLYTVDRRHSPIPADIAENLRAIASRGAGLGDDRFIKVGDSITVSPSFLHCFAGGSVDLDGRTSLQPSLDRFRAGVADGTTPFDRSSVAAAVGWSANAPLAGAPSLLEIEHDAVSPRFAVVMFGTNDVGFRDPQDFARDVWTITDLMIDRGTIPLLSTIPPRDDLRPVDARVPLFNLAVRAIAQGRRVPLVDFHRELLALPAHGLGPDRVHPRVSASGGCDLTAAGLQAGYNVRNLITLEQLDRTLSVLEGSTPDAAAVRLEGTGTTTDPFVVQSLPFAAMGDTSSSPSRTIDRYSGCDDTDEGGPEVVYRIEVTGPGTLTAAVLSASGVDADVHLLEATLDPASCIARDDRVLGSRISTETYFIVVDTFVDGLGAEAPGEYLIVIFVE